MKSLTGNAPIAAKTRLMETLMKGAITALKCVKPAGGNLVTVRADMTYRYPEYRIKVDGVVVAGSNSFAEAARYVVQYWDEGQVTLEKKTEAGGRWKKILTVPKIEEEDDNDTN